jgi:hypothetical protein
MMKTLPIFILVLITLQGYSQAVKGTVYDKLTKQEIASANVFFNGTTIGTITDFSGNFTLQAPEFLRLPIAVSALGYHSLLVTEYPNDEVLKLFLTPRIYELSEVVIQAKRTGKQKRARERNLILFREQFIGRTMNAAMCKITNEKDIIFTSDNGKNVLKAYTNNPLVINNEALGYKIFFYLESFEFSREDQSMGFFGNYIFRENIPRPSGRKMIENRRELAYSGSRMHFFRSLWDNTLDSAGFTIESTENKELTADSLVIRGDHSMKYVKGKSTIKIGYITKWTGTDMDILFDSVYFDKSGYFDPFGIRWSGVMTAQRVADMLPFDYISKKDKR